MPFKLSKTLRSEVQEVIDAHDSGEGGTIITSSENRWRSICKRAVVYHCKDLGLVVKIPNFILNERTPLKVRVPTIRIDQDFVVQPYVEKVKTKEAYLAILKKLKRDVGYDLHRGNVGWYNGKPVMFDW